MKSRRHIRKTAAALMAGILALAGTNRTMSFASAFQASDLSGQWGTQIILFPGDSVCALEYPAYLGYNYEAPIEVGENASWTNVSAEGLTNQAYAVTLNMDEAAPENAYYDITSVGYILTVTDGKSCSMYDPGSDATHHLVPGDPSDPTALRTDKAWYPAGEAVALEALPSPDGVQVFQGFEAEGANVEIQQDESSGTSFIIMPNQEVRLKAMYVDPLPEAYQEDAAAVEGQDQTVPAADGYDAQAPENAEAWPQENPEAWVQENAEAWPQENADGQAVDTAALPEQAGQAVADQPVQISVEDQGSVQMLTPEGEPTEEFKATDPFAQIEQIEQTGPDPNAPEGSIFDTAGEEAFAIASTDVYTDLPEGEQGSAAPEESAAEPPAGSETVPAEGTIGEALSAQETEPVQEAGAETPAQAPLQETAEPGTEIVTEQISEPATEEAAPEAVVQEVQVQAQEAQPEQTEAPAQEAQPEQTEAPAQEAQPEQTEASVQEVQTLEQPQEVGEETPAAPGEGQETGGETPAAPGEGQETGGETPAAPGEGQETGGETPAAPGEGQETGGETPAAPGEGQETGGETPAASGESQETGGETPAAPGESQETGGETPAAPGTDEKSEEQAPAAADEPQPQVTYKVTFTNPADVTVTGADGTPYKADEGVTVPAGTVLNLTANTADAARRFSSWTVSGEGSVLSNPSSASTQLTTGTADATVTAGYLPVSQVQVTSGSGSGAYAQGEKVAVKADPAATGWQFDHWEITGGSASLESPYSATTSFIMPGAAVSLRAVYSMIEYTLTVTGGKGGGSYTMDEEASLEADWPASGKEFDKWVIVSGHPDISGTDRFYAALTMPASDVTVRATYKDGPNPAFNAIEGLENGAEYLKGTTLTFHAAGNGMGNTNPNPGDYRYKPTGYQIGSVSGSWQDANYTTSMAINAVGDYTLTVTFTKEVYRDGAWTSDGTTDTRSVSFRVVNALSVQTGDSTPIIPLVVAAVAALAIIIAVLVLRRRR